MINPQYYDRLAQIESGGDPNAKNPKSSASGLFQFTSATAKQYGLEDPTDPVQARQAVEKFTADNAKTLQAKLGRPPTEGELYLAHQQGAGGALKLLEQPDAKAIEVLGVDEVLNNGGDENMTAKDFAAKWTGKFGDAPVASTEPQQQQEQPASMAAPEGPQIMLPDGNIIQLTGQETPEQKAKLKAKLFQNYGPGNISIDRKTGAPATIRAIVGSVQKPEDRLATIQKYYPDAFAYGDDNFAFMNPDTGKMTLYNPKGLDWGDAPSLAREAVQVVGSSVGAAVGATAGVAGGPPGVVAGAMAGSGLGTSISGSVFDTLMNKFGLTVDERTPGEVAMTFAAETAAGAIGEGVGRGAVAVGGAVKEAVRDGIFGGRTIASKALYDTFQRFGIDPSASMVANKAGMGRLEASLAQTSTGAEILSKQADDIVEQTQKAVSSIVKKVGTPRTPQGAGETIRAAAVNAAERFQFTQEKVYAEAFDLIGETSPVRVDALKELYGSMAEELSKAPNTMKQSLGPAMSNLRNIIADAADSGIEFKTLRDIRTAIGRDLATPQLVGTSGSQNAAMKRIYGALTDDMSRAAASTSEEAARKLKTADRFTRMWMNTAKDTMNKIANFDADEKAYKFALNATRDGGTGLSRLRKNFTPDEWDTVASTVLNEMGKPLPGQTGEFSAAQFLTNWNKLAPEAKTALFGGKRYAAERQALEELTGLMGRMKDVSKFANTSNTAGALQTSLLMTSVLGGGIGAVVSGDLTGGAQGAALGITAVLAPRYAAKLITSPAFVKWLAEPMEQTAKGGAAASITKHIARLTAIVQDNPDLEEPVDEYIKVLENNTKE